MFIFKCILKCFVEFQSFKELLINILVDFYWFKGYNFIRVNKIVFMRYKLWEIFDVQILRKLGDINLILRIIFFCLYGGVIYF